YPFKTSPSLNAAAIWYLYTRGELHDGSGHGGDVFKPEARAGIKAFVDKACNADTPVLLSMMGTDIRDVFDPAFSKSVANAAGLGEPCPDALCKKCDARFKADRPHLALGIAKFP